MLVADGNSNFGQLRESWQVSQQLRTLSGHALVSANPYFNARLPSRFFDPALPGLVGRQIDVCYEVFEGRSARGGPCQESTGEGRVEGVTFDDPRSAFDGVLRDMDINSIRISNAEGPEIWYTDPLGRNGRTEPFPGSIKQFIAQIDNDHGANPHGPAIGKSRHYGGPAVHAPN